MKTDDRNVIFGLMASIGFVVLLWLIKLIEIVSGADLHVLGIYPRDPSQLHGILLAPLIHGSMSHIVNNSLSVLILGTLFLYGYPKSRWWTLTIIWLGSGLGVWLFARDSFHFGASGLTHGMLFFLFLAGIIRRDKRSLALMMAAFFMYGGMLLTVLPREVGVSFEYHLFGALPAIVCAVLFRNVDPRYQRKVYDWENEPDDSDDDWSDGEWSDNETRVNEQTSAGRQGSIPWRDTDKFS